MMRRITLLCRIVDNLGDAGVSLRFARLWVTRFPQDEISLWTDDTSPFVWLLQGGAAAKNDEAPATLSLCEGRLKICQKTHPDTLPDWGDVVIEAFGSPVPEEWRRILSQQSPAPFWINLEYLSAERWVEDFHGKYSTDPATGWRQLFFFPGFTEKTGGLLGLDPALNSELRQREHTRRNDIFVFCYENAPIQSLLTMAHETGMKTEIATTAFDTDWLELGAKRFEFIPQVAFDAALLEFRLLFVRGEDSFVRAQLAGVPMVWQIYPTEDGAHWTKLTAFFDRYTETLEPRARQALWNLWCFWNGGTVSEEGRNILRDILDIEEALIANALRWQTLVEQRCHLIEHLEAFLPPRC